MSAEHLRRQARAMRREGHTLRTIMNALGYKSPQSIHRHVKDIPPPRGRRKWRSGKVRNGERMQRARILRETGMTLQAIADALKCAKSTISIDLRRGA